MATALSNLQTTSTNPIEVVGTVAASGVLIAAIGASGAASVSFTLGGVNVGDFAEVSLSVASAGIVATAAVQQAGTILVTYVNPTAGGITLGAHDIYFKVRQHTAV
jgi:hypothetical protein